MKYAKQSPREFVPFEYSDVTLENIRCACKVHYRENLTTCDMLASEQRPSCSRFDQIPSFKVIYVRFIMPESGKSILSETLELNPFQSQPQHKNMWKSVIYTQCYISNLHSKKYSVFCGTKKRFCRRYVDIWGDHQTCRKKKSQCWG